MKLKIMSAIACALLTSSCASAANVGKDPYNRIIVECPPKITCDRAFNPSACHAVGGTMQYFFPPNVTANAPGDFMFSYARSKNVGPNNRWRGECYYYHRRPDGQTDTALLGTTYHWDIRPISLDSNQNWVDLSLTEMYCGSTDTKKCLLQLYWYFPLQPPE